MAKSAQARKRARQAVKNRAHVFHKNKAARHKSRLSAKVKAMA